MTDIIESGTTVLDLWHISLRLLPANSLSPQFPSGMHRFFFRSCKLPRLCYCKVQETSGVSSLSSFISSVRGSSEDSRNGRAWLTHCNTAQHDNTISRKSQHCRLSIFLYLTQRVPFHHFRQFGLRVSPLSSSNSFGLCTVKDSVVIPWFRRKDTS
jgi:hypothetical protein